MQLTLTNVRKAYGDTVALGEAGKDSEGGVDRDRAGPRSEEGVDRDRAGPRSEEGVDLDVDDGEFFTLVGPSGCGKTTTLRLVAGFETPSLGSIQFDGREMRGVPPEDRDVGVVFQNYALFPHLSVAENVAYGLRFADPPGGESRDERVASLLELVDLPDAGDRDPTELSGGQQQRVALARALAPGPDLLLLDEPMSALDARLRERLRVQIKEIQSTLGITTLYVTHDQEEALAVSDRVAVMNDGVVEQVGTPRAVYRRPASRFVAEFVGDNNVFEGRVVSSPATAGSEEFRDSVADDGESPVETKGLAGSKAREPGAERRRRDDRSRQQFGLAAVDVDGRDLSIATSESVGVGDRVVFCVRPEQLRVLSGSDARSGVDGDVNVLEGTVSGTEFLGESTRTSLQWNGQKLTVRSVDPLDGDVRVRFDAAAAHVVTIDRDA
ncbi:ABC transporter ATP-binding protein [Halobellus sp. Atlit-31R]|nr:ABC transporter ATP-binding protein [Halobellus sp. Atlit-31R]